MWQDSQRMEGQGRWGGFCGKLPEAFPTELFPYFPPNRANANQLQEDLLLDKAEPSSNCCSTSGITYFRRNKKYFTEVVLSREK